MLGRLVLPNTCFA